MKKNKFRIVLGDIHGRGKLVEEIYNKWQPDEVILLGDYADSFIYTPVMIKQSWDIIRNLQEKHNALYKNKSFITLMGNHDLHYILSGESYSGKNANTEALMKGEYLQAIDENRLPIIYIDTINKTIYSHAGITNIWLDGESICNINEMALSYFRFDYSNYDDFYGTSPTNSPLWVRPEGLLKDPYQDEEGHRWAQIVGHTKFRSPISVPDSSDGKLKQYYWSDEDKDIQEIFYQGKYFFLDSLPEYFMLEELDGETNKLISRKIINLKEKNIMYYS